MLVLTYNYIRITKSLIKNFIIYSSVPEKKLFEYPQSVYQSCNPFLKRCVVSSLENIDQILWKDKYEDDIDNDNES